MSGRVAESATTQSLHCRPYHIPFFLEKLGKLSIYSGQAVEKINDEIKFIHQKRSNKTDTTVEDLKTRKRIELLIDQIVKGLLAYTKREIRTTGKI